MAPVNSSDICVTPETPVYQEAKSWILEEFVWCWRVTCSMCVTVLTGNRPSVPKPPASRDHLLLQNQLLRQLQFQLQLQRHPISMRNLGTAKCESTFYHVYLVVRKIQYSCLCKHPSRILYILQCLCKTHDEFRADILYFEVICYCRDLALTIPC